MKRKLTLNRVFEWSNLCREYSFYFLHILVGITAVCANIGVKSPKSELNDSAFNFFPFFSRRYFLLIIGASKNPWFMKYVKVFFYLNKDDQVGLRKSDFVGGISKGWWERKGKFQEVLKVVDSEAEIRWTGSALTFSLGEHGTERDIFIQKLPQCNIWVGSISVTKSRQIAWFLEEFNYFCQN